MGPLDSTLPQNLDGTRLRRFRADDLECFQAYRADAGLARYQGWQPMDAAQARAFVAEMATASDLVPGDWIQLAIADAGTDALIGDLGIYLERDGSLVEFGFTLCRAAHGLGHATRAVRAAVALAFAISPARAARGITDTRNLPSIGVLERAGFERARLDEVVFKGERCIEATYLLQRAGADGP